MLQQIGNLINQYCLELQPYKIATKERTICAVYAANKLHTLSKTVMNTMIYRGSFYILHILIISS